MKKMTALFLSMLLILSAFSVCVSAKEEQTPEIEVIVVDTALFRENRTYLPITGRDFAVSLKLNHFDEGMSSGEVKIIFNGEVLEFKEQKVPEMTVIEYDPCGMPIISSMIDPKVTPETKADSKNELTVTLKGSEDAPALDNQAAVIENFSVLKEGTLDFYVTAGDFKDGKGKAIEPEVVYTSFPAKSHDIENVPSVKLDYDLCLVYGHIYGATVELSASMTAGEFKSSVSADGAELSVESANGKILGDDELIPTGAVFRAVFDNVSVFYAQFVLIGDVNGDAKITSADARLSLRYAASLEKSLGDVNRIAANTASDRPEVTAADARETLRLSAGIGTSYDELYHYHCLLEKYNPCLLNDNL